MWTQKPIKWDLECTSSVNLQILYVLLYLDWIQVAVDVEQAVTPGSLWVEWVTQTPAYRNALTEKTHTDNNSNSQSRKHTHIIIAIVRVENTHTDNDSNSQSRKHTHR